MHTMAADITTAQCYNHLAGNPFIMPIQHLSDLQTFEEIEQSTYRTEEFNQNTQQSTNKNLATWLIEGEIFYSILCIQDPVGSPGQPIMLLYDHQSKSICYLRRDLWINNCPINTILLAHFIWDQIDNTISTPKLLIFDTLKWAGQSMINKSANDRYDRLLTLELRSENIISLQFVGEYHAVKKFIQDVENGMIQLPHNIKCCIQLTNHPLQPHHVKQ